MSMHGMDDPKEMGRGLLRQGQFDQAAAVLREAVAMDATDEEAWRLLGGALASKGDAPAAVDAFQKAVDLAPTAGRSHYNLALAYQSAGRLSDAKSSLERALSLDPGYEQARTRLAEVERQMGAGAPATPAGLSGVGSAPGLSGLASVGAPPPQESGHTNLGGGNTAALSSIGGLSGVGGGGVPESGHTNIGGGNTAALGGLSGGVPPASAAPSLRSAPPTSAGPTAYGAGTETGAYVPPPSLGMSYGNDQNTSGTKGDVPSELRGGWNWGAFYLSWVWLMNHGLVPLGIGVLIVGAIPYLNIIMLPFAIYLGIKGNELGWQNRRFQSVEDFQACQKIWAKWALGIFVGSFVLGIIIGLTMIPAILRQSANQRGAYTPGVLLHSVMPVPHLK